MPSPPRSPAALFVRASRCLPYPTLMSMSLCSSAFFNVVSSSVRTIRVLVLLRFTLLTHTQKSLLSFTEVFYPKYILRKCIFKCIRILHFQNLNSISKETQLTNSLKNLIKQQTISFCSVTGIKMQQAEQSIQLPVVKNEKKFSLKLHH